MHQIRRSQQNTFCTLIFRFLKMLRKPFRLLFNAVKRPQKQPAHQTTHQHSFTSQRRTTMIFAIAAALLTAVLLYYVAV